MRTRNSFVLGCCLIGTTLCPISHATAEEQPRWWLYDRTETGVKMADVRRASKLSVTDEYVALNYEAYNGMLSSYFESKNPETVKQMRAQIEMSPSLWVRDERGEYILFSAVTRVDTWRKG